MLESLVCFALGHKPQTKFKSTGVVPPGTLCKRCWKVKTLNGWQRMRIGP